MGAWGPGNFENDGALDWLAGFVPQPRLTRLTAPLREGLANANSDPWDWQEALTAAEIVALIRGHPSKDCPEHLCIWAQQGKHSLDRDVVALAREFISHVVSQAKTAAFAKSLENPEFAAEFLAAQMGLLKRLKVDARKLPKAAGQPGSTELRKEPWVSIGYVRFRKGHSESTSMNLPRFAIPDLPSKADLPPRPEWRSSVEVRLDFFFTPAEVERLVRLIRENSEHRIHLVRLNGGTYFKNRDLTSFLSRIAPHVEYLDLLVSGMDLAPLANASRLSKLSLHLDKKARGSDLQYLKGMGELEILIIGRTKYLPCGDVFSGNAKLKYLVITAEELENNRLPELPASLEELSLHIAHTTPETDISAITRLPKLRRFSMSADQFRPLPVSGFGALEFAEISSSITDASFLAAARAMQDLWLPPLLANLDFLRGLTELRRLRLHGGYKKPLVVTDLTPLEELPKLRTLHLSHSEKIDRVPKLRHVERFECYRVPGFQLEQLAHFPALRQFSQLSSNLSDGIVERLKVIAPNVELLGDGWNWEEAEPSRYNTYFG